MDEVAEMVASIRARGGTEAEVERYLASVGMEDGPFGAPLPKGPFGPGRSPYRYPITEPEKPLLARMVNAAKPAPRKIANELASAVSSIVRNPIQATGQALTDAYGLVRGTMEGVGTAGASTLGVPLTVADWGFKKLNEGKSNPAISSARAALKGVEDEFKASSASYGTTGTVGNVAGRIAGDVALAYALGPAVLAKLPQAAQKAIQSAGGVKKFLALQAANLPVDVLQGLQYDEGMLLKGRTGSVAENVAISAIPGGWSSFLSPTARRGLSAAMTVVDDAAPRATTRRVSRQPAKKEPSARQKKESKLAGTTPTDSPAEIKLAPDLLAALSEATPAPPTSAVVARRATRRLATPALAPVSPAVVSVAPDILAAMKALEPTPSTLTQPSAVPPPVRSTRRSSAALASPTQATLAPDLLAMLEKTPPLALPELPVSRTKAARAALATGKSTPAVAAVPAPAPVVNPIVKTQTDRAREDFLDDVGAWSDGLAGPAKLRALTKKALEKGYITELDAAETLRVQKNIGSKDDTSDAFSELLTSLQQAPATPTVPEAARKAKTVATSKGLDATDLSAPPVPKPATRAPLVAAPDATDLSAPSVKPRTATEVDASRMPEGITLPAGVAHTIDVRRGKELDAPEYIFRSKNHQVSVTRNADIPGVPLRGGWAIYPIPPWGDAAGATRKDAFERAFEDLAILERETAQNAPALQAPKEAVRAPKGSVAASAIPSQGVAMPVFDQGVETSIGAVAGYAAPAESDRERLENALQGASLSFLAGKVARKVAGKSGKRTPEEVLADYNTGTLNQTIGTPKKSIKVNPSQLRLGRIGSQVFEETEELEKRGLLGTTVSLKELRKLASKFDGADILKSGKVVLSAPQIIALNTYQERVGKSLAKINTKIRELPEGSPRLAALEAERASLFEKTIQNAQLTQAVAKEQGTALRVIGEGAIGYPAALRLLRETLKIKNDKPIPNQLLMEMVDVFHKEYPSEEVKRRAVEKFVNDEITLAWYENALGLRKMNLLTGLTTHLVNLTGNASNLGVKRGQVTPIATALDILWSKATGAERTMTMGGYPALYSIEKKKQLGRDTRQKALNAFKSGGDATESSAATSMKGGTSRYWRPIRDIKNITERIGVDKDNMAGRAVQKVHDVVYGSLAAGDVIFYESAYNWSRKNSALLHANEEIKAINKKLPAGKRLAMDGPKHAERFAYWMDPANASLADELETLVRTSDEYMANYEAQFDTFKLPTPWAESVVRKFGPVGDLVAPFVKTPTNVVKQGLDMMVPGAGLAAEAIAKRLSGSPTASDLLRKGLEDAIQASAGGKANKEVVEKIVSRAMRKQLIERVARMAPSLGFITAGFFLTTEGLMTGEVPAPMGRDSVDRKDQAFAKTRGVGPLSIRFGDTAHSILWTGPFMVPLAMGHALALEHKNQLAMGGSLLRGDGLASAGLRGIRSAGRTAMEFPVLSAMKDIVTGIGGEGGGKKLEKYLGQQAASLAIPALSGQVARAVDSEGERLPDTFGDVFRERIPFARNKLPLKVGPLGETPGGAGFFPTMFSPTRPRAANVGRMYDQMESIGYNPPMREQGADESNSDYSARRRIEGVDERKMIAAILDESKVGFDYATPTALRTFNQGNPDRGIAPRDFAELLASTLQRMRTNKTQGRKRQEKLARELKDRTAAKAARERKR